MNERTANLIRDELEQDIVLGKFKPGDRLDEVAMAARFGVSRTPIREALAQLAASDLIELKRSRGAFVRGATIEELVQMFEVMAELEAMCGRLSARRMSADEIVSLRKAHQACTEACDSQDTDQYYYCNELFHGLIYAGCSNTFLKTQTETLRNRLKPYRRMQLHVPNRVQASLAEHERIVEAIEARDEQVVDCVIKAHIQVQGEKFNALVTSMSKTAE